MSFAVTKIHMVYWNTTNPLFRIDNTDHIVDVNEGNLPWEYDQLNIICPQNSLEQHVVYSVSEEEYNSCRVTNPRPKIVALCNKPQEFKYFTITFRSFSPTPGGLEFKPGQNYYFISTSTQRDIHRRAGGFCSSHNMKMIFRVSERDDPPQPHSPVSPLLNILRPKTVTTTSRPATSSVPVYYYKSRTPSVHTSDYIYYYSPRDLIQLKLAARKYEQQRHINTENEISHHAEPLTGASSSSLVAGLHSILAVILFTLWTQFHWTRNCLSNLHSFRPETFFRLYIIL